MTTWLRASMTLTCALAVAVACGGGEEEDLFPAGNSRDGSASGGAAGSSASGGSSGSAAAAGSSAGGRAGSGGQGAGGGSGSGGDGGGAGASGSSGSAGAGGSAGSSGSAGAAGAGGGAGAAGADAGALPLGAPCTSGSQCASTHCQDGVCCESACTETCVACNSSGACEPIAAGTDPDDDCADCTTCDGAASCMPVADGTDPLNDCDTQDPTTCGTTGVCASGACELWGPFTVCGAATCSAATLTAQLCDGAGSCGSVGVISCAPYTCNAAGDACRESCQSNAHCVGTIQCDVSSGTCLSDLPLGSSCTQSNQCTSGFCVDGVCCENGCDLFCASCAVPGDEGTCRPIPRGADPDDECPGDVAACDGACDGSGGCEWPDSSTSCNAGTTCVDAFTGPQACNGYGGCEHTEPCPGNFACSQFTNGCRSTCNQSGHCAPGNNCLSSTGSSTCVDNGVSLGDPCTSEQMCPSGDCGDDFDGGLDCPNVDVCVECDQDSDCPSGRCDGCTCEDREKSGQNCNEDTDCLSGDCQGATCR